MAYSSTYGTARTIAQLISVTGWIAVVVAAILLFFALLALGSGGFLGLGGLAILAPSIGLAVGGLLLVGTGQLLRASVDTADFSGEILALMKVQQPRPGQFQSVRTELTEQGLMVVRTAKAAGFEITVPDEDNEIIFCKKSWGTKRILSNKDLDEFGRAMRWI